MEQETGRHIAGTMIDERSIVLRGAGQRHGPITRLISPGDIGQQLKPFVFLDYVDVSGGSGPGFGFHPHSGLATLTYPLNFDIEHESSSGQIDVVRRGGVEWVVAGSGIWHRAKPLNGDSLQAFQLWFALPPSHENAPAVAQFIQASEVPVSGPVTVLLGSYREAASKIAAPVEANYFWVKLKDGESWEYQPPDTHQVAWVFAQSGTLELSGAQLNRELAVMEEGNGPLQLRADGDCAFLVGSAARHPYELALGSHSVHTDTIALAAGSRRIDEIGQQLQRDGKLQ